MTNYIEHLSALDKKLSEAFPSAYDRLSTDAKHMTIYFKSTNLDLINDPILHHVLIDVFGHSVFTEIYPSSIQRQDALGHCYLQIQTPNHIAEGLENANRSMSVTITKDS